MNEITAKSTKKRRISKKNKELSASLAEPELTILFDLKNKPIKTYFILIDNFCMKPFYSNFI